ncbi:MAG TPA: VWA domain-containing protein [Pyrinomonadaceae bacterium]|nr:VWA domain-containing protein [Pyrinomonadaceae bacterium]
MLTIIGTARGARLLAASLVVALCAASVPTGARGASPSRAAQDGAGLRLLLPPGGAVRIENAKGGVRVEVWGERFVSVSAEVENAPAAEAEGAARANAPTPRRSGRASSRRAPARPAAKSAASASPVRVERSESLLSVVVPREFGTASTRVELRLRVPAEARVKIFAGEGRVEVRGLPAALDAQTVSGDISLGLPSSADAELTAHSLNGEVAFEVAGAARTAREKFQTRLGAGGPAVRLFSGRGRISVAALSPSDAAAASRVSTDDRPAPVASRPSAPSQNSDDDEPPETIGATRRPPTLIGADGRPGGAQTQRTPPSQPADAPQEVDEDEVVRVETDLVTINVSVVERGSGRGLTGLTQNDFRLYEDGAEQQIEQFESSSAPFDLLLLIDLSGSTAKVTNLIRASALRFVNAARPRDRIGVVTFAGETNIVSPPTADRDALRAAINAMEPPKGDTRLYDAVGFAMQYLDRQASQPRRRAIVLMSDGLDSTLPNVTGTGSTLTYDELRSRVQEFDGVFYSVWTSTEYEAFSPEDIQPETFDLVHDRMSELSEAGGGDFYAVNRLEDLAGAYERVVADLGTLYSLSYRPTNKARDGRFRAVRIKLPRHPNAVARGRRGYHAK